MTLVAALSVWALGPQRFRERALVWLDAVGLATYSVVGAAKATSLGVPPASAVAMGVLTAAFGGVLRDVLAGVPSVLLRKEIYVTAALLGSIVFVLSHIIGLSTLVASIAGFVAAFALRAGAIVFRWSLPAFRGRDPEGGP